MDSGKGFVVIMVLRFYTSNIRQHLPFCARIIYFCGSGLQTQLGDEGRRKLGRGTRSFLMWMSQV